MASLVGFLTQTIRKHKIECYNNKISGNVQIALTIILRLKTFRGLFLVEKISESDISLFPPLRQSAGTSYRNQTNKLYLNISGLVIPTITGVLNWLKIIVCLGENLANIDQQEFDLNLKGNNVWFNTQSTSFHWIGP